MKRTYLIAPEWKVRRRCGVRTLAHTFILPTQTTASRAAVNVSVQAQNRLRVRATRGRIPRLRVCCACEGHASPASLATPHDLPRWLSHGPPRWPSRNHVGRAAGGDCDRCRVGGGRVDDVACWAVRVSTAPQDIHEPDPSVLHRRVGTTRRVRRSALELGSADFQRTGKFAGAYACTVDVEPVRLRHAGRRVLVDPCSLLDPHAPLPHNVCPPLPHRTA